MSWGQINLKDWSMTLSESYAQFLLLGHQRLMQHHLTSICLKHQPVTSYNYKNVCRICKYFKVKQGYSAYNEKSPMSKNWSKKQLVEESKVNLTRCNKPSVTKLSVNPHSGLECNLNPHLFWCKLLSSTVKQSSPPHVKRFCRSTRCSGHEHLGVPSPLAMQICEHPPLSWEHGWTAGGTHKKVY